MVVEEEIPAFELPEGSQVEEVIKTLDFAQRLGYQAAYEATAAAFANFKKAEAVLTQVVISLGLDPALDYPIDEEGHVYTGKPKASE